MCYGALTWLGFSMRVLVHDTELRQLLHQVVVDPWIRTQSSETSR